jgi:excinuclease ABC subunit A
VRGGGLLYAGPGAALFAPGGPDTETAQYLRGERRIARARTAGAAKSFLTIEGAREHNLRGITVRLPLGRLTCVTGVSGSGKSTLVEDLLYPAARNAIEAAAEPVGAHDAVRGLEALTRVVLVDQSPIGKSPRSNPLTYVKGFDALRELYARSRWRSSAGSRRHVPFSVAGGRCETARATASSGRDGVPTTCSALRRAAERYKHGAGAA